MLNLGDSAVEVHREGALGFVTLNRPARGNSLDVQMARDFRRIGLALCRDEAVRCVVLRGAGGAFCSGADLKYIASGASPSYGAVFKEILEYLHSAISEFRRAPKPVIAAVDGMAAAGGLGLALCCDVVLASERAKFEFAYFKTALTGAESTTFLLPRLLGLRRAQDLAFLNPRLSAVHAQQWGLVSHVFPTAEFDVEMRRVAVRLAEGPTRAYADAKRLMNETMGFEQFEMHLSRELEVLTAAADRADFSEGLAAFLNKRPAHFEGR